MWKLFRTTRRVVLVIVNNNNKGRNPYQPTRRHTSVIEVLNCEGLWTRKFSCGPELYKENKASINQIWKEPKSREKLGRNGLLNQVNWKEPSLESREQKNE